MKWQLLSWNQGWGGKFEPGNHIIPLDKILKRHCCHKKNNMRKITREGVCPRVSQSFQLPDLKNPSMGSTSALLFIISPFCVGLLSLLFKYIENISWLLIIWMLCIFSWPLVWFSLSSFCHDQTRCDSSDWAH